MLEYITGTTPEGETGKLLRMTVEAGKALCLPIEKATEGDGVFSCWIKKTTGTGAVWIDFCGEVSTKTVSTNWQRIVIKGTIDREKPIRLSSSAAGAVFLIHKAQLEETHIVSDWTPSPEDATKYLKNGAVEITDSGVDISGGTIRIRARGIFEVDSQGVVKINAKEKEGSYINLDADSVKEMVEGELNGGVFAVQGAFSESLRVGGNAVLTEAAMRQKVIVSFNEPQNVHDVIWVKPEATTAVHFTAETGTRREETCFGFTNPVLFSLAGAKGTMTAAGTYVYRLSAVMYKSSAGTASNLMLTLTLTRGNKSVSQQIGPFSVAPYVAGAYMMNFYIESNVNLADSESPISCSFHLDNGKIGSLYINAGQTLDLSITNPTASEAVSTCTVHYIA